MSDDNAPDTVADAAPAAPPAKTPKTPKTKDAAPAEVIVRITKFGAGKVHNGEWDVENNCGATYPAGEMVVLGATNAQELEDRQFAEIQ